MKTGIVFSAFDLLHAGHVSMLSEAKDNCDYLICGLHTDPSLDRETKNPPVQTLVERYVQLSSTKYVDEIIPYQTESDLLDILNLRHDIDIRFLGKEYEFTDFTGKDLCERLGIKIHYNRRTHGFSSSDLRSRIEPQSNPVMLSEERLLERDIRL